MRIAGLVLAGLLLWSVPAHATVANPGFETGAFPPWTTSGSTAVIGSLGPIAPPAGSFQAQITTGGGSVTQAVLETFFGIAAGTLDGLGNGNATEGSGIQQTFVQGSPGSVTFQVNFLTNEGTASPFNDFAFLVVDGAVTELADTTSSFFSAAGTGFAAQTGFFSLLIPFTAGSHTIGFGIVDVLDTVVDSALLIDVPAPLPLVLVGVGLAALAILRRRIA